MPAIFATLRPASAAASPEAMLTAQLGLLTSKIDAQGEKLDELKSEVTDRLARVETDISNLKGRK